MIPPLCIVGVQRHRDSNEEQQRGSDTYDHFLPGSMEGISPPESRGIYSHAQDDEAAMSNGDYLGTLTHQQVRDNSRVGVAFQLWLWSIIAECGVI